MKKILSCTLLLLTAMLFVTSCMPEHPKRRNITLSDTVLTLKVGQTHQLRVTDIDERFVVDYRSEDPDVASVDKTGKVTALKVGDTDIKVHVLCPCGKVYDFECELEVKE